MLKTLASGVLASRYRLNVQVVRFALSLAAALLDDRFDRPHGTRF